MRITKRAAAKQSLFSCGFRLFGLGVFLGCISVSGSSIFAQEPAKETAVTETTSEWQSLFDGESLAGWDGPAGLWRVEDGCIVGQSTAEAPIPHNLFLIWKGGELADFELRLKYWIDSGNSGVQIRSREIGTHRIGGYQADLEAGKNYTGIVYEEGGRGILCLRGKKTTIHADGSKTEDSLPFDGESFAAHVTAGQWNDYVIRAQGNHIVQFINGIAVAELIDEQSDKAAKSGLLALQLHAGPPMLVKFKDIRLKQLKQGE